MIEGKIIINLKSGRQIVYANRYPYIKTRKNDAFIDIAEKTVSVSKSTYCDNDNVAVYGNIIAFPVNASNNNEEIALSTDNGATFTNIGIVDALSSMSSCIPTFKQSTVIEVKIFGKYLFASIMCYGIIRYDIDTKKFEQIIKSEYSTSDYRTHIDCDTGKIIFGCSQAYSDIYISYDKGETISLLFSSKYEMPCCGVSFLGNRIACILNNKILLSDDNGKSWTEIFYFKLSSRNQFLRDSSCVILDDGSIVAFIPYSKYLTDVKSGIYMSKDSGKTWELKSDPYSGQKNYIYLYKLGKTVILAAQKSKSTYGQYFTFDFDTYYDLKEFMSSDDYIAYIGDYNIASFSIYGNYAYFFNDDGKLYYFLVPQTVNLMCSGKSCQAYYYTGYNADTYEAQTEPGEIKYDYEYFCDQIDNTDGYLTFPEYNSSHSDTEELIRPNTSSINGAPVYTRQIIYINTISSISLSQTWVRYPGIEKESGYTLPKSSPNFKGTNEYASITDDEKGFTKEYKENFANEQYTDENTVIKTPDITIG